MSFKWDPVGKVLAIICGVLRLWFYVIIIVMEFAKN